MAFTEAEAKVLGTLSVLDPIYALTARQLCHATGLTETSIHRALMRLSRTGLAIGTVQSPARWRSSARGRVAIGRPVYREYARPRS
ncbi:hypothetical protein [Nocardia sp. NPDC020380]|uniref:hypothetical protein n=1 Tax=Nocardia sp. NPDC020380 TaxID=3364309 RepID=UPI00378D558B